MHQLVASSTAAGHLDTARTLQMLLSTMVVVTRALMRTVSMSFLYGVFIAVNGDTPAQLRVGVQLTMATFQYISILGEHCTSCNW